MQVQQTMSEHDPFYGREALAGAYDYLGEVADKIVADDPDKMNYGLMSNAAILKLQALSSLDSAPTILVPLGDLIKYRNQRGLVFPKQYSLNVLKQIDALPEDPEDDVVVWNGGTHKGYVIKGDSTNFTDCQLGLVRALKLHANENQRFFEQKIREDGNSITVVVGTSDPRITAHFIVPLKNRALPILNCAEQIVFEINPNAAPTTTTKVEAKKAPLAQVPDKKEAVSGANPFQEVVLAEMVEAVFAKANLFTRESGETISVSSIVAQLFDTNPSAGLSSRALKHALLVYLSESPDVKTAIAYSSVEIEPEKYRKILTDLHDALFLKQDQTTIQKILTVASKFNAVYVEARNRARIMATS
jgi:hypothetical protein